MCNYSWIKQPMEHDKQKERTENESMDFSLQNNFVCIPLLCLVIRLVASTNFVWYAIWSDIFCMR